MYIPKTVRRKTKNMAKREKKNMKEKHHAIQINREINMKEIYMKDTITLHTSDRETTKEYKIIELI